MSGVLFLIFMIIWVCLLNPKSLGRWLAKVENSRRAELGKEP